MKSIIFDNHDHRIKYYELMLEKKSLDAIPDFPLPDGYSFELFKPGDMDAWIDIEMSAKELTSYEQGIEVFEKYFGGKDSELVNRMVFIKNEAGEKIATATAYYDIYGRDKSGAGWLHWVAVRREYQGRGLAKPLISHTLRLMHSLGYAHAKIPTQTTTWLACKIYLDFGFTPIPQNAINSRMGWRIVKTLTNHPALENFEDVSIGEILGITWLFFDVGSTLVNETEAYAHRIRDMISGTDITFEQFQNKRIEYAKQNLRGDLEAMNYFGLTKTPWHHEDEKPYNDAEDILKNLKTKGYKIGVIANQSLGTRDRLDNWGLMKYIDLVIASAEEGVAKPSPEIFNRALERAGCKAENAVMIGDRLDNDICPAKKLGMKTIWAKFDFSAYQTPQSSNDEPDMIIDTLSDLKNAF